jgi:uncharacterized protein (TIGR02466 family)
MTNELKVDFWFPTPIWSVDLDVDNTKLKRASLKLKEDNPDGRVLSNRGGWQSHDFHPEYSIAVFQDLVSKVVEQSDSILQQDYGITDRCTVVNNFWININTRASSNQVHSHPGAFLSAVYYISAPQGSGNICFERDAKDSFILGTFHLSGKTPVSGVTCEYPPIEGRLMLFPGWLSHSVIPSQTDEERISIAFNVGLKTASFGGLV